MTIAYLDLADSSHQWVGPRAPCRPDCSGLAPELSESALHAPATCFSRIEFYPDLAINAAVLCTRLAKNH